MDQDWESRSWGGPSVYELKIIVKKVMGECTADPPMKPGDHFIVSEGDIRIPEGGYICLWALQSLMPMIPAKEREIAEQRDEDWMWRVHHAQCPDPKGRVIFEIERTGKIKKNFANVPGVEFNPDPGQELVAASSERGLKSLRIVVESVGGHCTSRMKSGDYCALRSGRLYIPPGQHFCLYALQAVLPMLPAKQRVLQDGDWLKEDCRVLCPDPAGNVILRIDSME
jgi:uncharacterized repeat protein (TIGR04076 family)